MKQYLMTFQKYLKLMIKRWIWPCLRRVFVLAASLALFVYICGKVNWVPVENWVIDQLAHSKPIGKGSSIPIRGRVSIEDTKAYKMEKYQIFKTNVKNTIQLISSKVGLDSATPNQDLTSISQEINSKSVYKVLKINMIELENIQENEPKVVLSDWKIIKDNLNDSFTALVDMISVRVMTQDGKPMIVEVVNDKPVMVEYDSSDTVMRWGKEIQAASSKYGIDPSVIAAMIEQESGGNPAAVSPAGAIGLML